MTHKQQAIERINLLCEYERLLPGSCRAAYKEHLTDLRTHVTLMEPVGNPACGQAKYDRPRQMDYFALATTLMRREAEASCALDGETHCESDLPATMPRVPMPRGPISLDAEEEPVLECSRCYGDGFECKAVDVDGHPECPSCGDRNNLRVRR